MTGRTHDLAAFTALTYILITQPPHQLTLGTTLVAFSANMIGGLAPDIDQPTADLWRRLPAGSVFGHFLSPLLGGHRLISHSIIGIILFGIGFSYLLNVSSSVLVVNRDIVWWSFMIGFISHLIMDSITHDGVPWLFPIPIRFGFPPFKNLRMRTGGVIEKYIVFPILIIITGYMYYMHYDQVLSMLKHLVK